jgi:hypothetical protein
MGRKRWWAVAAGVVGLAAVLVGLSVAAGCPPRAFACVAPTVEIRDPQSAGVEDFGVGSLTEVAAGEEVGLVGYAFASCDDTSSGYCSVNGRVEGPREVAFTWRQPGRPDVPLAEGRIQRGGTFEVDAAVPADAAPGAAHVVVVREGQEWADTVVQVVEPG